MTRQDAIRNMVAFGWSIREVERAADNLVQDKVNANSMERLLESMRRADELLAGIKSLAKRAPNEPRIKVSPYAKFDKLHKKNRKRK